MQTDLVRIWTVVAVSISYDDKHYITGTSPIPKGISPKVNIIAWLEFKFTYYDVAVHYNSHCGMGSTK